MEMTPFTPEMKRNAEELFMQYRGLICSIAYGILKDRALAEDCLQETVIRLAVQNDNTASADCQKPEAFVRTAARNISLDILRKRCREMPFEDSLLEDMQREASGCHTDTYFTEEYGFSKETSDCLNRMKDRDADLIILRVAYIMPYVTIAKLTGEKTNTVEQRFCRAKKKLAELLEESL